jgi:hypothetical protein
MQTKVLWTGKICRDLQKELKKLDQNNRRNYVYNLLKFMIIYTPIKLLFE